MTTTPDVFDNHIGQWNVEQNKPWGILRYKQTQANLAKHLGSGPLHILDAGGGNGLDSLPLAQQGHFVEIVDYSEQMLDDAMRRAEQADLQDRIAVRQGNVQDVDRLFPESHFDVVLCHNVLQYVDDVPALLKSLTRTLRTNGLLSLISINRYSLPLHTAFVFSNLTEALSQVDGRQLKAHTFDTLMTNYSAEEISGMVAEAGCRVEQDYGLRCLYDYWGDNDRKFDPVIAEQLERLEFVLMDRYPYKLLARYYHVIARKKQA